MSVFSDRPSPRTAKLHNPVVGVGGICTTAYNVDGAPWCSRSQRSYFHLSLPAPIPASTYYFI